MKDLEPQRYGVAERLFSSFADHLSVAAVLGRHVEGRVLVDDPATPTVGLLHGPEGVYLGGGLSPGNDVASLRGAIDGWAYLHIAPDWTGDLAEVFPHPFMLLHERRTFSIATSVFDGPAALPTGFEAVRAEGFGCRILHEGVEVSRCLPDMVAGDRTEVGIWTHPGYRRRGLALAAAQTALAAARAEGIVVAGWHCVASNRGSAHLAQRLGGVQRENSIAYSASPPAENTNDLEEAEWRRLAAHFDHAAVSIGWMAFHAAGCWAQAGERDRALEAVEHLVASGWDGNPDWLADNWALAGLTAEPRFVAALKRLRARR
jgi:GNAT superfamily N-acetyltransferase